MILQTPGYQHQDGFGMENNRKEAAVLASFLLLVNVSDVIYYIFRYEVTFFQFAGNPIMLSKTSREICWLLVTASSIYLLSCDLYRKNSEFGSK